MEIRAVGSGLIAGIVGTAALSAAERAEMALTHREASTVPGQVGARLAGREPEDSGQLVERLTTPVHWAHGVGLGAVRALLDGAGLRPLTATLVFYPLVWGGDAALYRALGVADVPWRWRRADLLRDLYGKGVLAFATSGAYVLLARAR
jgi:hypothetical protein